MDSLCIESFTSSNDPSAIPTLHQRIERTSDTKYELMMTRSRPRLTAVHIRRGNTTCVISGIGWRFGSSLMKKSMRALRGAIYGSPSFATFS
jgi:hypothetical protein